MENEKLTDVAFNAITTHGPDSEEFPGIGLFANHHKDEIPSEFWTKHTGTATPSAIEILNILVPLESADEDEELEDEEEIIVDFTLPGDVTQYVLSVSFDESGEVIDIAMES